MQTFCGLYGCQMISLVVQVLVMLIIMVLVLLLVAVGTIECYGAVGVDVVAASRCCCLLMFFVGYLFVLI